MKSLKGFLSRHWKNILTIRQTFRFNEETIHLILAGGVGVIGGLTNACFDFFNRKLQLMLMRSEGDPVAAGNALPWWETVAIPTVGGLMAGLILYFGLQIRRSPRSGNLLEVVQAGDGKLSFSRGLLNAASSLFSISSGAPVGREGAITQLTATFASKWGQWHHWHPYRLRLLVACGAAAGMSAAYNAPIAGAVFAAQIVLGNFSMRLFGPLIFSSVIASIISRSFFGIQSRFEAPTTFLFNSLGQLPAFLVLGILSGIVGALFLRLLHGFQAGFQKIHIPIYLKIGLAGILTGVVAVLVPEVLGNGFFPINSMLNIEIGQSYDLDYLVSLFGAKLLLTAIVFSAGAVGGVFTPTLFFGACTGCFTGVLMQKLGVATDLPISVFVIVGMGSVLAATTHSALLALIMGFELSANYSLMPPLMLACAVSALVAQRIYANSIYDEPLRLKGLIGDRERPLIGSANQFKVGDLMRNPVPPLKQNASFDTMTQRFLTSTYNYLPVIDAENRLAGMVELHDLKQYFHMGSELKSVIAYDVMKPVPLKFTPHQSLIEVLPELLSTDMRNIPVVSTKGNQILVGVLVKSEALALLSEAISIQTGENRWHVT